MSHSNDKGWKNSWKRWHYLLKLFKLLISTAPKEVIFIMFMTILMGMIPLLSIYALQHLVNAITELGGRTSSGVPPEISFWVALFILALILQFAGNIFGSMVRDHMQERIKVDIQGFIIEKTHHLSLAQFENPEFYDQLQRANKGLESRLFSTMAFIFRSISDFITLVSLLLYLGFIHWGIPLILLIGSTIFSLVQVRLFTEQYILERKQTTDMRKLHYFERLLTAREAAREIRLFGLGDHIRRKWKTLNEKLITDRIQLARRESRLELISSNGNTITFTIVLTGVVYIATVGLLSVGQYAAFIQAVIQFQEKLTNFFWSMALVHNDLRYMKDFFDYLELPEEQNQGVSFTAGQLTKGIECKEMSFAYPGVQEPIFQNIDLHIKPGERIALVGNNGSGKTTLIKLLLGLYKPTNGKISVEGMDLEETDIASWRKKCTAIFQDFHKYHMTVKDNIAIGQVGKMDNDKEITRAAIASGADEMIKELPKGYETFLGKEFDGQELSQGQWQKVAIARAYIRDAELLILDEPTASLDPQAEVEVYKQFKEIAQDKTTIFISHRLGICKLVDRIIVLHNGGIAEQGTHEQLMQANGHYAHMYRLQAQWYA
ncbi:ABC transporter ATP-binding protein/permease [Lederbergia sp. NSJ-179]|uniref:ABC transporter ATP-binding protein n=1 Tax=Lederbergia sp. NSJ-179 TaxID=2931402 RepID=UPI001FD322A3|nr:ABC transporter ATP-binding protein [Lederbergia sp. NSJ-179]MCJ7839767.1 ABC transporter ATP-binding protein/permease [Lederbergia sp. NSJ-179]